MTVRTIENCSVITKASKLDMGSPYLDEQGNCTGYYEDERCGKLCESCKKCKINSFKLKSSSKK